MNIWSPVNSFLKTPNILILQTWEDPYEQEEVSQDDLETAREDFHPDSEKYFDETNIVINLILQEMCNDLLIVTKTIETNMC